LILSDPARASVTVSAALIVKNEARTLGRCLESIRGAVDDIVVVDTGSRDETADIARAHGARVFEFAWRDDFAAARQFAFDRATSDWVFWLDADDEVTGADRIRSLVTSAAGDVSCFYWRYILGRDARGVPTHASWRERCVRNDGSYRWVGRVHEVLVGPRPGAGAKTEDVFVEHHPIEERAPRSRRNLEILEAEVAAAEDRVDPRQLFYLGREYIDAGDVRRGIDTLARYVALGTWADERYLAQVQIADLHRAAGRYPEALDAYWAAIKILPRWPDAYFGIAATYYFLQEWASVAHWTEIARTLPVPDSMLFLNLRAYESGWIIYYTNALYRLGRHDEALLWTQRALVYDPDNVWHRQNVQVFLAMTAGTRP
jgi:glycosyltransferase involved in cell wall biosynthesis